MNQKYTNVQLANSTLCTSILLIQADIQSIFAPTVLEKIRVWYGIPLQIYVYMHVGIFVAWGVRGYVAFELVPLQNLGDFCWFYRCNWFCTLADIVEEKMSGQLHT